MCLLPYRPKDKHARPEDSKPNRIVELILIELSVGNHCAYNPHDSNENPNKCHFIHNTLFFQLLKKKFYPGSDTRDESYYELYNKIENHFKEKPNEGCYICLCDGNKGYYHTIPSGFPGFEEKGLKCPYCDGFIGTKETYIIDKDDKENQLITMPTK